MSCLESGEAERQRIDGFLASAHKHKHRHRHPKLAPKLAFAAAINGKVVLAPKSFRAVTARGVCLPVQDVQDPGAAD